MSRASFKVVYWNLTSGSVDSPERTVNNRYHISVLQTLWLLQNFPIHAGRIHWAEVCQDDLVETKGESTVKRAPERRWMQTFNCWQLHKSSHKAWTHYLFVFIQLNSAMLFGDMGKLNPNIAVRLPIDTTKKKNTFELEYQRACTVRSNCSKVVQNVWSGSPGVCKSRRGVGIACTLVSTQR